MGLTKDKSYTIKEKQLAALAKTISHPARIVILKKTLKEKEFTCNELVDEIGLSQATISQHLKELKTINLIEGRTSGSKTYYHLNKKNWNLLNKLLFDLNS